MTIYEENGGRNNEGVNEKFFMFDKEEGINTGVVGVVTCSVWRGFIETEMTLRIYLSLG